MLLPLLVHATSRHSKSARLFRAAVSFQIACALFHTVDTGDVMVRAPNF